MKGLKHREELHQFRTWAKEWQGTEAHLQPPGPVISNLSQLDLKPTTPNSSRNRTLLSYHSTLRSQSKLRILQHLNQGLKRLILTKWFNRKKCCSKISFKWFTRKTSWTGRMNWKVKKKRSNRDTKSTTRTLMQMLRWLLSKISKISSRAP